MICINYHPLDFQVVQMVFYLDHVVVMATMATRSIADSKFFSEKIGKKMCLIGDKLRYKVKIIKL